MRRIRPALDRAIERVRRRSNNFLAFDEYVRQLGRLVDIGFDDRLERNVPGFFIPRPNKVPRSDFFNCDKTRCGSNSRSGNKACAIFQITGIAAHAALYCAGDCAGKSAVAHAFQCGLSGTLPAACFSPMRNCTLSRSCSSTDDHTDCRALCSAYGNCRNRRARAGCCNGDCRNNRNCGHNSYRRNRLFQPTAKLSRFIYPHYRIIAAISEQIGVIQAVCGNFTVFRCVSVDEPMCYRVVISALEVIEPCLGVVVVPTVAQRVDFCLGAGA